MVRANIHGVWAQFYIPVSLGGTFLGVIGRHREGTLMVFKVIEVEV